MLYYPIPEGVNVSQTKKVSVPRTDCHPGGTNTKTVSFKVNKSTVAREKTPNSVVNVVNRPSEGSWSRIKESGTIKMTEMSIINSTETHYVAGIHHPFFKHAFAGLGSASIKINGVCVVCGGIGSFAVDLVKVQGRYLEQGDLSYWKEKYPDAPHHRCVEYLDPSEVEKAKADAYSELFTAYNLGEELAEFRETISGIHKLVSEAVSLILKFRPTITALLSKGLKKEASSRWMEFRYGIMPIIYSIQDILALKGDSGVYRTVRTKVKPKLDEPPLFGYANVYFEDVGYSQIRCNITAKARWASEKSKILDLININPITTAVEIYPWAMVIGWFLNVSSFINTRVKSLTSLATETAACVAVKETMEYGTYLSYHNSYNIRIIHPGDGGVCGPGFFGATDFGTYWDNVSEYVLLAQYSKRNYNRYLYQPQDVKLVWSPYFDWRRSVDGLIIGSGKLSKLLRSLK